MKENKFASIFFLLTGLGAVLFGATPSDFSFVDSLEYAMQISGIEKCQTNAQTAKHRIADFINAPAQSSMPVKKKREVEREPGGSDSLIYFSVLYKNGVIEQSRAVMAYYIYTAAFRTPKGVRIGDSTGAVRRAYGIPNRENRKSMTYLCLNEVTEQVAGTKEYEEAIAFILENGTVVGMRFRYQNSTGPED